MKGETIITKSKIIGLHIAMLLFLVLLILSKDNISDKWDWLVYFSTLILILHIWLGAYYIVRYLKEKDNILNILMDIIPLICIFISIRYINNLIIWGILFAAVFSAAIIKYKMVNASAKEEKIKRYTSKKISNEIAAIPLFLVVSLLAYVFEKNLIAMHFLKICVFLAQIFYAVWLIKIKKVYSIFSN